MKTIYSYLTYAGTIPFIFCAFCLLNNTRSLPLLGSVENILGAYSLIISSFVAGAHWGQHLHIQKKLRFFLSISSNMMAVVLWISYLALSFKALIVMFILAFVILLFIELKLLLDNLITMHYFRTRCFATIIVILSLITSGIVS